MCIVLDVQLQIMKNADHYNPTSPGNFQVFGFLADRFSHLLAQLPDTPSGALTLYNVTLPVPTTAPAGALAGLQVIYNTNNPKAPAAFFACADVQIAANLDTDFVRN